MILLVKLFAITLAWTFVQSNNQRDKLFFLHKSSGKENETLLVVTWTKSEDEISPGCEYFRDKDLINEVLQFSNDSPIRTLSEDEMENLLEDCTEFNLRRRKRGTNNDVRPTISSDDIAGDPNELFRRRSNRRRGSRNRVSDNRELESEANDTKTTTEESTTPGYDGLPVIFPGTKWCGAGDLAEHYDDLGRNEDTDRCCRAHDLCNDTIAPGETKNNLTNKSSFTKLSCECDEEFYNCLNQVNTITSNTIGNMYFNLLRRECYRVDYPTTKTCKKYRTFLKLTCLEYEKDTQSERSYQWAKAQTYRRIPVPGPLTVTLPF